ncbi:uncharacterized protein LOC134248311 [Saccostrea cucullata]|uniref:uncharacterized protein LOC134248311 n=1 Tax=Saccostrea cuccullata TaxID=36930 RepID=UPI002ED5C8EF
MRITSNLLPVSELSPPPHPQLWRLHPLLLYIPSAVPHLLPRGRNSKQKEIKREEEPCQRDPPLLSGRAVPNRSTTAQRRSRAQEIHHCSAEEPKRSTTAQRRSRAQEIHHCSTEEPCPRDPPLLRGGAVPKRSTTAQRRSRAQEIHHCSAYK